MIGVRANRLLILLVTVCSGWAAQTAKPECNSANRGEVWPARKDQTSASAVEMCTLRRWRYRWERVTVSLSELTKDAERKGKLVAPREQQSRREPASRLPDASREEVAPEEAEVVNR